MHSWLHTIVEKVIEQSLESLDVLHTAHAESVDQLEGRQCGISRVADGRGEGTVLYLV